MRKENQGFGISPRGRKIGKITKNTKLLKIEKTSKIGKLKLVFEGASHLHSSATKKVSRLGINTNPVIFKEQLERQLKLGTSQPIGTGEQEDPNSHSNVIGHAGKTAWN